MLNLKRGFTSENSVLKVDCVKYCFPSLSFDWNAEKDLQNCSHKTVLFFSANNVCASARTLCL